MADEMTTSRQNGLQNLELEIFKDKKIDSHLTSEDKNV